VGVFGAWCMVCIFYVCLHVFVCVFLGMCGCGCVWVGMGVVCMCGVCVWCMVCSVYFAWADVGVCV
jgi:hypothetical protein